MLEACLSFAKIAGPPKLHFQGGKTASLARKLYRAISGHMAIC
jgi:hypothetical protein